VVDSNEIEVGELDWESDEAKRNDLSWFDMYRTNTSANVVQPKNAPKEESSNKDPYWQWRCGINEDNQVEGRLLFNIGRLESEILRGTTVSPCLGFLFRLAEVRSLSSPPPPSLSLPQRRFDWLTFCPKKGILGCQFRSLQQALRSFVVCTWNSQEDHHTPSTTQGSCKGQAVLLPIGEPQLDA